MTDFFIYNQTPEIIQKKLTRAELDIYTEIKKLSKAVKNSTVFASIDYLIKHSEYNSKSFISKTLARLIDKGLLVRELVQSNKSRHKCYQYYIVYDLKCTKLYQDLTEEEQKRYIGSVNATDAKYINLSDEENKLYCYLKFNCGIDMTHRKLKILIDCAKNNTDIVPGTELDTILLMAKYCMNANNKFGYLKKTIINYSTGTTASYIPQDKPIDSEQLTDEQERLYKACNDMNVRLSVKQIKAIVGVANRLKIDVNKVMGIISDVIHVKGIKDVFRYIIKSVYNYNKKQNPEQKTVREQSYDLDAFEQLAVTFSGNTKQSNERKNCPDAVKTTKRKEQSYDLEAFEKLAITFSGNTKNQD